MLLHSYYESHCPYPQVNLVLPLISCVSCGPAEELKKMERIMMQYFPFSTLLNTRVGPEALAHRVATVFGLKYIPGKRNIIGQEQVSTNKDFEEIKLLINNSFSQDIANRVERV